MPLEIVVAAVLVTWMVRRWFSLYTQAVLTIKRIGTGERQIIRAADDQGQVVGRARKFDGIAEDP